MPPTSDGPLNAVPGDLKPTGQWAAALLHALARDEAAERRPRRLTEPDLATWNRFRGRLDATDFVALLFEDAAVLHRVPFDGDAIGGPLCVSPPAPQGVLCLARLPTAVTEQWLATLADVDLATPGADYVADQARLLGLPTRLARSDLHVVKPHQKVLELPGTGGQLAHHLVSTQDDLTLQDNFTVACATWQELTLAGIVALDLAAPHTDFAVATPDDDLWNPVHSLRQRRFDFVVGLHPEKGGQFEVKDQLAIWFSGARCLLV